MSKILVITSRNDPHADHVIQRTIDLGRDNAIVRINTEDFASNTKYVADECSFRIEILDSKRTVTLGDIAAVWYRRPKPVVCAETPDPGIEEFFSKQNEAILRSLYFATHHSARWINPLPSLHQARHKLPQLQLAVRLGVRVPRTIITNVYEEALTFLSNVDQACTKSLTEPNYRVSGKFYPFMTRKVTKEHVLDDPGCVEMAPTFLQEYINKIADVRITVFGHDIVAVRIYSQAERLSQIDFRGVSPHLLEHKTAPLPPRILGFVRSFMNAYSLRFAAFDFVLTPDDEFVFIECNPNGQWLWLEQMAEVDLTTPMLNLLFSEL